MPSQDRFGPNHAGQSDQAWPQPRHQFQQSSVTGTEPQTMWRAPQGNIELVPEKQVLDLNPAPRAERVDDRHCKQMAEGKHHAE
jgi:hypothetical protein